MTGKPPSVVDVRQVEVEVDTPLDRSGKLGAIDSDGTTETALASGTTSGVMTENDSNVNWYVYRVTAVVTSGPISPGEVVMRAFIEDPDGTRKSAVVGDLAVTSTFHFGGNLVRPGDQIRYEVTNSTSSDHDLITEPMVTQRADEPSSVSPRTYIEQFERDSPLADYTTDFGSFSVDTTTAYSKTQSATTTDTSRTEADASAFSRLPSYGPDSGFRWRTRCGDTSGTDDEAVSRFEFSLQDNGDSYEIQLFMHDTYARLVKWAGGTQYEIGSFGNYSFDDFTWYTPVVERVGDDEFSIEVLEDGDVVMSDTLIDGDAGGVGPLGDGTHALWADITTSQVWWDDIEEL